MYVKQSDGDWKLHEADGLDAVLRIEALGIEIPLAEIYYQVTFDEKIPQVEDRKEFDQPLGR